MLILVVGPSGAGKDTLMEAARAELALDSRFRFVRLEVTRVKFPLFVSQFQIRMVCGR